MKLLSCASVSVCFFSLLLSTSVVAQIDPRQDRQPLRPTHPSNLVPGTANVPGASPLDGVAFPAVNFANPAPLSWTALGPASLDAGVPTAGRVAGVAVDPTNANIIYVAAAGGGVWKTTDAGVTYTPITDAQASLAMGAIAVAPSNHLKIYAGTGEANNAGDSNYGQGILVSNDGGTTWSLSSGPANVFFRRSIAKISVDPSNANTAYAAVNDFNSNSLCCSGTGIYKSTDGGTTWANTTTSVDASYPWSDVVVDPNTPTIIYAAHGDVFAENSTNGVYRSTDGGVTWSLLANASNGSGTGRFALAVAPSANSLGLHVLYVAITQNINTGNGTLLAMLRSDNADAPTPTFTTLSSTPNFVGQQGWYNLVIGVDPSNSAIVYGAGSVSTNIIRSTNSGASWSSISTVNSVTPHTDCHAMAFDSSNRLVLGNDGGVWRYDSTVPSWTNINGNLNTIQFTGIGQHPSLAGTLVGGSQDNGTEVTSGSLNWVETGGGDGGYSQISQTNPLICYSNHPIGSFGTTQFFQVSTNGCQSFSSRTPSIVTSNNFNFYAPIFVDPLNGNRVFLAGDAVYESTNAGTAWTRHTTPAVTPIDTVAALPGGQTIYIAAGGEFASTSTIYVSINDGAAWTLRSLPVGGRVQEIDIDPNDATGNTAVAVINTFNSANGQVYRTINGGIAWTNISGNLPAIPTWSAKIDTDANQTVYVSNEQGVYSSSSPFTSWSTVGTGLPKSQANQLQLNSTLHILAAATHGRGAWYIYVPSGPPSVTSSTSATFTVGAAGTFTVTTSGLPPPALTKTGSFPSAVTFVDNGNGTATIAGTPAAGTGGQYPVTLTAQNGVTPNATQNFTLIVNQAPAFTSSNSTTFTQGSAGLFSITTSGYPAPTISLTGTLPTGVTFTDNGNGTAKLQGAPGNSGTFNLTLSATNGVSPVASQSLTLTVLAPPAISFSVPKKHDFSIPFTVSATSNSPGAISFAVDSGPASLSGTTVTLTGATGSVQMEADQVPSGAFSAGQKFATFTVTKGSVVLVNGGSSSLSEFDLTGSPFTSNSAYTGGGLSPAPAGSNIAIDGVGNIWVADAGSTGVSKFNGEGVPITTTPYAGTSSPGGIAIDGGGNAWVANGNGKLLVLSNSGATVATISDASLNSPKGVAIDSSGNVWVVNQLGNNVDEVIGGAIPAAPLAVGTPGVKP